MSGPRPRRGIERKILNTILLIGIIPLLLAVIVGYIAARGGQGGAVEQALSTAANKTSDALRIATLPMLSHLNALAREPVIAESLTPSPDGSLAVLYDPAKQDALNTYLTEKLQYAATSQNFGPVISVFSTTGELLGTSNPSFPAISQPEEIIEWKNGQKEPGFVNIDYLEECSCYVTECVAPVYAHESRELLGFVSRISDSNTLFTLVMSSNDSSSKDMETYQVVFLSEGIYFASNAVRSQDGSMPQLDVYPSDPTLAKIFRGDDTSDHDSMRINNFRISPDKNQDVFVAYSRLLDNMELYVVVYRSVSGALMGIRRGGALAIVFCTIVIAILCMNAYLNVHNNIVRPVSLLNEGAQIIGQGDLDLKLKIDTGDEIEELAQSFNKMALALKQNVVQLEESEEKYRGLVTWMRDGIFQTDPDYVIGFVNPAGIEVFRYSKLEEMLGKKMSSLFFNPGDFTQVGRDLQRKGFVDRRRVWMRRKDDHAIIVEISANTIYGDNNEIIGYEGIFRDLSKSVRLERESRDRAERLSAVSQIASAINSSLEAGKVYESFVREIKRLIDFDCANLALLDDDKVSYTIRPLWPEANLSEKITGKLDNPSSCVAWVARERRRLTVPDLFGETSEFTNEGFTPSTHSALCVPLYAAGHIIGTLNLGADKPKAFRTHDAAVLEQVAPHVAIAIRNANLLENLQTSLQDVTQAREKLHAVNEELKSLDEMKTNLLSNVSHELRTPLVAVLGYTDMILNEKVGAINDVQKEYLGISLRNVEKLVTLIENLLDFSKLHKGAEKLVFEAFDLVECASTSIQTVTPVADGRSIQLILNAPDEPVYIEGDKGKIGQVFINLLSNGVKFNNKDGNVTIDIKVTDESALVSVSDTGIGIPADAHDKIFTRFYQFDGSSTRKYGGTGIGLAIAQDIARLHGATITLTSEVGKGSTFRFTLPLRKTREALALSAEEEAGPATIELLVELVTADTNLGNQVRNLLVSDGINVIQALNGMQAVSLAQKYSPDCLLIDMHSGKTQGQLLDTILECDSLESIPKVIITSDNELFGKYKSVIAARMKSGFRKSTLLSCIHNAAKQAIRTETQLGNRILCVDDDPDILIFLTRCLENEGYEVDACESGEEAIKLAATRKYRIVLLDIAMPGIDGWETCKRIKSDPSLADILVYMVTAKPLGTQTPQAKTAGSDGFIQKPFKPEDIIEVVATTLCQYDHTGKA